MLAGQTTTLSMEGDLMRLKRLAALPLVLLLAGCPNLLGSSGNTELNPKALAVTNSTGAGKTAVAHLTWQPITNASTYQVFRVTDETLELATTSDKTAYTEQVEPGHTVTYKVIAKDSSGTEKASSAPVKVQVMLAEATPPSNIRVAGETDAKNLFRPTTATPVISWDKVANATHYYVKIDKKSDGKTLYASLTDQTQVTVGSLSRENLTLIGYPQVKGQGLPGDPTLLTVTAIRADDPDLAKTTAIDIKPSATYEIYRQ